MKSKVCMNEKCGASLPSSIECKKGWRLRSGELASLCDICCTVYEQLVFCDTFHSKDTGWRECTSCGKRLHCGCIASSSLLELLDSGGVKCISCSESHGICSTSSREKCKGSGFSAANGADEKQFASVGNQSSIRVMNKTIAEVGDDAESNDHIQLPSSQNDDAIENINQMKAEETFHPAVEFGSSFLSFLGQSSIHSTQRVKPNDIENMHGSPVTTNLTISLSATSGNPDPFPAAAVEERELGKKISSFPQGSKSRHLLPKPPKSILAAGLETSANTISQIRVARPPVEGRVKNQLLPRYWPRITDQELQKISGELYFSSNSIVVPLFEKVLSASDAGRIGRLVLPKACAEAYFPPISQPEGLPLRIQDVKGKEWVFQFRFWPNNNSRMYVLEGVTPCIQSMQLQAGDTVTFSRMDPEGKLLMGFRKASNTYIMQDKNLPSMPNGTFSSEPFFLPVNENLHTVTSQTGLLQSLKGRDFPLSALSKHFNTGDFSWHIAESNGGKTLDGPMSSSTLVPERKRSRNIGSKNKRLLIDSQDALELKLSWEELQDMLRPPSGIEPSTVTVEDYEFEEYEQPPVLGKKSIFTVRLSGEQEQWVQCDSCLKWRRLPADILLPPKWTCQDNTWNLNRASCSVPDELSPQELENLLQMSQELKKQRPGAGLRSGNVHESSNQDALGNSTAIGGNTNEMGGTSVATTTKHPRHRPGCSCIVCIQPPSGKGKHKPTCTCNVCMTVKRRFKTLMMRKKKRQSEREAEIAQRNQFVWDHREGEVENIRAQLSSSHDSLENQRRLGSELQIRSQISQQPQKPVEIGNGKLDLNSQPDRGNLHMNSPRISMVTLLQEASLPLETYLKQNGLTSLVSNQQASSGSNVLHQATRESENVSHGIQEPEDSTEELSETDQSSKDPS